eukprot:Clim_evm30s239 gene=Clim_evmTU30s239
MTSPGGIGHRRFVLSLYKSIRRLNNHMPKAMADFGNQYVRDEFKRHKDAKPEFIEPFLKGWLDYKSSLELQIMDSKLEADKSKPVEFGSPLTMQQVNAFSEEQIGQLQALHHETSRWERAKDPVQPGDTKSDSTGSNKP